MMVIPESPKKHEIVISRATTDLTSFLSSGLVKHGLEMADLLLFDSPLAKVEKVLACVLKDSTDVRLICWAAKLSDNIKKNSYLASSKLIALFENEKQDAFLRLELLRQLANFTGRASFWDKLFYLFENAESLYYSNHSKNSLWFRWYSLEYLEEIGYAPIEVINRLFSWIGADVNTIDSKVLLNTIASLAKHNQEAINRLIDVANNNKSIGIRLDACESLVQIGMGEQISSTLISLRERGTGFLKYEATRLLGDIGVFRSDVEIKEFYQDGSLYSDFDAKIDYAIYLIKTGYKSNGLKIIYEIIDELPKTTNNLAFLIFYILLNEDASNPIITRKVLSLLDAPYDSAQVCSSALGSGNLKKLSHPATQKIITYCKALIRNFEQEKHSKCFNFQIDAAKILCTYQETLHMGLEFLINLVDNEQIPDDFFELGEKNPIAYLDSFDNGLNYDFISEEINRRYLPKLIDIALRADQGMKYRLLACQLIINSCKKVK